MRPAHPFRFLERVGLSDTFPHEMLEILCVGGLQRQRLLDPGFTIPHPLKSQRVGQPPTALMERKTLTGAEIDQVLKSS